MSWIHESNLIEGVDDPAQDVICHRAFDQLVVLDKLTQRRILSLHKYIMVSLRPDIAGKYRTCGVMVGGRICPSWRSISWRMPKWMREHSAANTAESIKAAHIAFEKIHPFVDGNGRTGRMIMNWQRVKAGMEPLMIRCSERFSYYEWFK